MPNKINSDPIPIRMRLLLLLTFTAMLGGLFILGAQPMAVGLFQPPVDKFVHVIFFSLLTISLWFGTNRSHLIAVFLSVILIAVLDEWHQYYLPGRSADMLDLSADILAAGAMTFIIYLIRTKAE
ncbi:MAG: VanZ family protein [Methylophilaceae bacterium]|nr:VanZ family protein [Methylophilaceae bacterium]